MLNRLILKVTKFQLPPPKHLGTVVKNILGGHHGPPMSNRVKGGVDTLTTPVIDWSLFGSSDFVTDFENLGAGRSVNPLANSWYTQWIHIFVPQVYLVCS